MWFFTLHFTILWWKLAGAKGTEKKKKFIRQRREKAGTQTQSAMAFPIKHCCANGFEGLTSSDVSSKQSNGIIFCLWRHPTCPFLFLLYLTLRELMELLWWWCMGDCVRRQMGKCNYGRFRALGGNKTCHKGELEKQRRPHSSCGTIIRQNSIRIFT